MQQSMASAQLPSPYPLPLAGEGIDAATFTHQLNEEVNFAAKTGGLTLVIDNYRSNYFCTVLFKTSRIASGDFIIFMKLFFPIMLKSGKLIAIRKRAYNAYTLLSETSTS